jgi:ABC-2 type transport system ATP-binding protein
MSAVLDVANVSKAFGATNALTDFSLSVPQGGVYGLLGPNGAGKSTLLRVVLGLIRADRGQVKLLGEAGTSPALLRRTGSLIETPNFWPSLSARDVLDVLGRLSGLKDRGAPIQGLLERVGIADAADRKVHGFSVGMKQRLGLAAALLTRPEVLILDEPTNGMDPNGVTEMRRLLRELADTDGVTVILSSHNLDEVQRLCDRVAIMDHGRLAYEGAVADMGAGSEQLVLTLTPTDKAMAVLGARARAGEHGTLVVDARRQEAPGLIRALVEAGVEITEARWSGVDLEAFFFAQTKGATR